MPQAPIEPTPEDLERALAKFAVIAPLVCRDLAPEERDEIRKGILDARHKFPGDKRIQIAPRALRNWCQAYRQKGLEGLLPQPRKDKGRPRVIPQEILDRALALRRELPSRSAKRISDMVAAAGSEPVAASTLSFHFRKHGLDRTQTADAKTFRRFEHPRPNSTQCPQLQRGARLLLGHGTRLLKGPR